MPGIDRHLPPGGKGYRTPAKIHGAVAGDIHTRQRTSVAACADNIGIGHSGVGRSGQAAQLAVQGAAAVTVEENGAGTALTEHHAGTAAGRVQVQGATGIHRSAGQQHAVLQHVMPRQGDITCRRHHQTAVADFAGRTVNAAGYADFIAAGGRGRVAVAGIALADNKTVARRHQRLAFGSADTAGVFHL